MGVLPMLKGLIMSNIEKKLDALIDALGFDVEVIQTNIVSPPKNEREGFGGAIGMGSRPPSHIIYNYKFTKRDEPVVDNEPVNHQWEVDTFTGCAFDVFGEKYWTQPSETAKALKDSLLEILKKAGKHPKKDTITLMNHEIDLFIEGKL
jgi:hypothetical protein